MRKIFLIFSMLLLSTPSFAKKEIKITEAHKQEVTRILKKDGFHRQDFEFKRLGDCGEESPLYVVIAKKDLKYNEIKIPEGSEIWYCNGNVYIMKSGSQTLEGDGMVCRRQASIEKGEICNCELAQDYTYKGHLIPSGSTIYRRKFDGMLGYRSPESERRIIDKEGKIKSYEEDFSPFCM